MIPAPSNLFEWLGLILFTIATPAFLWFLVRDIKRGKNTGHW